MSSASGPSGGLRRLGTRGVPREDREQMILEVAGQAFAADGYHSASMDEIAQLAGISKPMLYSYFGSKEGLYLAYINRTGHELVDRLVRAAPQATHPDALWAPILEFLAFVEEHRDGWIVLFRETASNKPIAEEVARMRARVAEAVRRMVAGAERCEESMSYELSDGVAHAIVGAGESLANWWLGNPGVRREDVASLYQSLVQSTVATVIRRTAPQAH